MKRLIIVILILTTLLSLCACGSSAPVSGGIGIDSAVAEAMKTEPVDGGPGIGIDPYAAEPTPTPFIDDTAAINEAAASVVKLNCFDRNGNLVATGSGFAALEDGIIVTNYHVIEDSIVYIEIEMESGLRCDLEKIVAIDVEKDIAILSTSAKTGLKLLPLGDSDTLIKGEKILTIGYPLGLGNSISTGIISSIYEDDENRIIQFTAPISHGNSGGALFNEKGEVVGITYASLIDGQNLNLAVPVNTLIQLWDNSDRSTAEYLSEVNLKGVIDFADLLNEPDSYEGQEVSVEGYISSICFYPDLPFMYLAKDSADAICITVKKDGNLIKLNDIETFTMNYKGDYGFVYVGEDGLWTSEENRAKDRILIVISPITSESEYQYGELYCITGTVKVNRKNGEFLSVEIENAVFDH